MTTEQTASRCYDIQVSLAGKEVPEFEDLTKIGMMVNLSLHIRGLAEIDYEKLKLVSAHYFRIPPSLVKDLLLSLAEIEFVRLVTEGTTIKKIIPQVPYFDSIYSAVGDFATSTYTLNEPEQLALKITSQLSDAPTDKNNVYSLGADRKLIDRTVQIGEEGGYILSKRARGRDILISPLFFSENVDVFTDLTAKAGASRIKKVLDLVKNAQGWPLALIEKTMTINNQSITADELNILKRLAQDGAVRPPSITTPHSGKNFFLFTPAPGVSKLNPSNKEIFEKSMAILSSVRQGQLLANKYAIRSPVAVLKALKRDGWLKSTSETYAQYNQLAVLKVGRLEKETNERYKFVLVNLKENVAALDLAIQLLEEGTVSNMEINQDARIALQKDQSYIESVLASTELRKSETITLDEESKEQLDDILLTGTIV